MWWILCLKNHHRTKLTVHFRSGTASNHFTLKNRPFPSVMCIFETDSSCCPAAYRKRHDCSEVRLQVFLQKTANVSKKGSTTHHTSTFQPGSFTHRIRHTLEVWFNQLPFTSCPVHASGLFDCIPLLECNGTRTQGVDHRLEVMQN